MRKNIFVKASAILATAIMTVSTIGITVSGAEENEMKSIALQGKKAYAGETVEIPLTMYTDNQCTCYDLLVEYDSNLEFVQVKGAKATDSFEEDGKKFISLTSFETSPYIDGSEVATIKLYVPQNVDCDNYDVNFSRITGFSSDSEDFENYTATDAVVSVVPMANTSSKIKPNEKHSECKLFQKLDKNGKVMDAVVGFRGDANGDGEANIRDAAAIAIACAGRKIGKMSEQNQFFGDVNDDGVLNIRDAATIARFLAKGKTSWDEIIK